MLLKAVRQRFSQLLDPSSSFDPLPAAACFLDPTVSAVMMRDDMVQLLASATLYIKVQVSLNSCMVFVLLLYAHCSHNGIFCDLFPNSVTRMLTTVSYNWQKQTKLKL
jgi:hypothetical protein